MAVPPLNPIMSLVVVATGLIQKPELAARCRIRPRGGDGADIYHHLNADIRMISVDKNDSAVPEPIR